MLFKKAKTKKVKKMIFEKEYTVENRDIGNNYKATNKALLKYLENIACKHSDKVGYGINDIEKTKAVWILLEWEFKVIERPKYGQTIKVKTWSRKIEKCHAYRDFEIYNENGKILAVATSKWVLVDYETRKIRRIPEKLMEEYASEPEKKVFNEEIEKSQEPEKEEKSMKLEIRKTDIDINNHVNNLKYLDFAYEILPEEVYNQDLKNIKITYKHQTMPGETINISYTKQEEKNIIVIKTQDKSNLHAIVEIW